MLATAAPAGWQAWLARFLSNKAEAGGGLMVAVLPLSNALGSTVSSRVLNHLGWQSTFVLSGLLLLCAVALTFISTRQKCAIR